MSNMQQEMRITQGQIRDKVKVPIAGHVPVQLPDSPYI